MLVYTRTFMDIEYRNRLWLIEGATVHYSPNHFKIFFDVIVLSGSCQSMVK